LLKAAPWFVPPFMLKIILTQEKNSYISVLLRDRIN